MVIDRFEGQKVKSTCILLDAMGMLQQLGAIPASPEPASKPNTAL